MPLNVYSQPIGKKLHRLLISFDDQVIGEYERSIASAIVRKKQEIECALPLLLDIFKQKGQFQVRWDGHRRVKSIRVNDVEVALIPRECWRQ